MADRILITMDDLEAAVPINAAFEESGFDTSMVSAMDDGRRILRRTVPDLVVLTGALHERSASEIIAVARESSIPTLAMIEETDPSPAKVASTVGLTSWIVKPADPREVLEEAQRLIERRRLQNRTGIIGESPAIQEVLVKIQQLASVSSTVLIEGESGTGKELAARGIHDLSSRRDQPFVAVNCAALPETLLESELFGHEKGAFTGAAERRLGRFELANGGTLFLDEVGEMPPSVQVKLLRVLEARSFFRVGGVQPIKVDVRVVTATNRSLRDSAAAGEFRDDLYYRLNVLYCYLPPLRERRGDIRLLVRRFARELATTHNKEFQGIEPEAMEILAQAYWPGNVRELRNLVESMVVLSPGERIRAVDIPAEFRAQGARLLPVRMPMVDGPGKSSPPELEFILRSLVDLKLQVEEIKRRIDQGDVVEFVDGPVPIAISGDTTIGYVEPIEITAESVDEAVVYREGMTMAEVERATIEAALRETRGKRRSAARKLGIGERTLYRKIKEYGLD
jgi:DNA-binding NtrC family response regulator